MLLSFLSLTIIKDFLDDSDFQISGLPQNVILHLKRVIPRVEENDGWDFIAFMKSLQNDVE